MTRLLALLAACALAACADDPQPFTKTTSEPSRRTIETESHRITVIHDDSASVTCWLYGHKRFAEGGISCLPDSALKPTPERAQ